MPFPSIPELIKKKRDGAVLTAAEIEHLVIGVARGYVESYQAAALLMAVFFRGLDDGELTAWTLAMRDSGRTLDWRGVDGARIDKHSTGGVGDKLSIPLAPIAAECGIRVPMISGRGLGHTGERSTSSRRSPDSKPNYPSRSSRPRSAGSESPWGQTADLAPADKMLYALRDVTGTVESIPLIVSSILSKKLAEGLNGLVLDVKVGKGAFMKNAEEARELAKRLVATARLAGCPTVALLTSMDAPLGEACGNANEIEESIAILRGSGPADAAELTLALAAEMLVLGRAANTRNEGRALAKRAIDSGAALDRFRKLVERQGATRASSTSRRGSPRPPAAHASPPPTTDSWSRSTPKRWDWPSLRWAAAGPRPTIRSTPGRRVGAAQAGARVSRGETILEVAYRDPGRFEAARRLLDDSIEIGPAPAAIPPLILGRIDA